MEVVTERMATPTGGVLGRVDGIPDMQFWGIPARAVV